MVLVPIVAVAALVTPARVMGVGHAPIRAVRVGQVGVNVMGHPHGEGLRKDKKGRRIGGTWL